MFVSRLINRNAFIVGRQNLRSLRSFSSSFSRYEEAAAAATFQSFQDSLRPELFKAITVAPYKYQSMTPVQEAVLSLSQEKQDLPDLLVRAKTGTGKTLAFLVPALQAYLSGERENKPFKPVATNRRHLRNELEGRTGGVLVISPTRELASQIAKESNNLLSHTRHVNTRLLVGGENKYQQLRSMERGTNDVVVATPGRLLDILQTVPWFAEQMKGIQTLIFDEADTLLDMGFSQDIERILEFLPGKQDRRTFFFSATVSPKIQKIAKLSLKDDHEFVDTIGTDEVATHEHIPQHVTILEDTSKLIPHIMNLLTIDQLSPLTKPTYPTNGPQVPLPPKTMIFLPTTKMTQLVSQVISDSVRHLPLGRQGTRIYEIHSKKDQRARTRASEAFRAHTIREGHGILITSDVSARGVDYPNVSRVIQIGSSSCRENYIHRIGRTGRAGKQGRGDLILQPFETEWIDRVLNGSGEGKPVMLDEYTVEAAQNDVKAAIEVAEAKGPALLTKEEEKSVGPSFTQSRSGRSQYGQRAHTSVPKLQANLIPIVDQYEESLKANILPNLPAEDVNEAFMSLLGYYVPQCKAGDFGRLQASNMVEDLKTWAVDAWGAERPHVSPLFLQRIGAGERRQQSRGGFGGRGDFGRRDHFSRGGRDGGRGQGFSGRNGFGGRGSTGGRDRGFAGRDGGRDRGFAGRDGGRDRSFGGERNTRSERY